MNHKDPMFSLTGYVKDPNGNAYQIGNIQELINKQVYAVEILDWTGMDGRVDVIGFNIAQFPFDYVEELVNITAADFTGLLIDNMRKSSNVTTYPFKLTLERKMFFEYILNNEKD